MRTSQSPRVVPSLSLFKAVAFAAIGALAASAAIAQETITLPAAASIVGISPFFSDVRIFNTSYTQAANITATYRCFLGPCPGAAPQITINLASRDSQAYNDIVANAFGSPNTAGGIEFTSDTPPGTLIITSRLYSTSPTPTVGMFIPGLNNSQANTLGVLTSIMTGNTDNGNGNGGNGGAGFRTNVGVFNPSDSPATVTFTGFANHAPVGGNVQRVVPPHSGTQINGVFDELGAFNTNTDVGVILVQSDVPVFSYAAVIDNNTSDPYLVIGSPDQAQFGSLTATPAGVTGTPTQTRTPVHQRTATPTPNASGSPTVTPTPNGSASPLVRRFADASTGGRPAPARSAVQVDTPRVALLFEERYLAVLRGLWQRGGGW